MPVCAASLFLALRVCASCGVLCCIKLQVLDGLSATREIRRLEGFDVTSTTSSNGQYACALPCDELRVVDRNVYISRSFIHKRRQ